MMMKRKIPMTMRKTLIAIGSERTPVSRIGIVSCTCIFLGPDTALALNPVASKQENTSSLAAWVQMDTERIRRATSGF